MALTMTLTGTGTSAGVPMIGCTCEVCTSPDPRDHRDRPGAMVRYADANGVERVVLIDTPPELRQQMIRHRVMRIDGVVFTHEHADHLFGLDDLRRFNAVQGEAIDVYAEHRTLSTMRRSFAYVFDPEKNTNSTFVPLLIPHPVTAGEPFKIAGREWTPIRVHHGRLPIVGYRVGQMAYLTDLSGIPPESYSLLDDLDVLVIDALRYRHHPTHLTVDAALSIADQLKPKRTYFTHIAHDILHADLEAHLPEHVYVGYDGLTVEAGE